MSTYQLGGEQQWGTSYKISPETTEVEQNVMKCFQVNGTQEEAVAPQAVLPQLQGFQVGLLDLKCITTRYDDCGIYLAGPISRKVAKFNPVVIFQHFSL